MRQRSLSTVYDCLYNILQSHCIFINVHFINQICKEWVVNVQNIIRKVNSYSAINENIWLCIQIYCVQIWMLGKVSEGIPIRHHHHHHHISSNGINMVHWFLLVCWIFLQFIFSRFKVSLYRQGQIVNQCF